MTIDIERAREIAEQTCRYSREACDIHTGEYVCRHNLARAYVAAAEENAALRGEVERLKEEVQTHGRLYYKDTIARLRRERDEAHARLVQVGGERDKARLERDEARAERPCDCVGCPNHDAGMHEAMVAAALAAAEARVSALEAALREATDGLVEHVSGDADCIDALRKVRAALAPAEEPAPPKKWCEHDAMPCARSDCGPGECVSAGFYGPRATRLRDVPLPAPPECGTITRDHATSACPHHHADHKGNCPDCEGGDRE